MFVTVFGIVLTIREERWIGKKVNLEALGRAIEGFMKQKGFICKFVGGGGNFKILCVRKEGGLEKVSVSIWGDSNDFVVALDYPSSRSSLNLFSQLLTFFGLGFLVLREVKMQDEYRSFEGEFWDFVGRTVANLAFSS